MAEAAFSSKTLFNAPRLARVYLLPPTNLLDPGRFLY